MSKIDMKSEEYEIKNIYEDYEKYRTASPLNGLLVIYILFLIFEILLFLLLIYINRKYKIKDEIKTNKYQSIILYSFFGFTLFLMINLNGKECKNHYYNHFFPDNYSENKSFININNSYYYIGQYHQYYESYFDKNELIYKIYQYNYTDYPILKEIYKIYFPNGKKKIYDSSTFYDSIVCDTFRLWLLPFITFFAYCFLVCYKCKNKCKIVFIILEICSLIIKLIAILLTYIYTKKYANKQNLKTEFKEIEYIIEDYNQYAKCVNQCNEKILEILFLIIEIFVFFYTLKNYENSNINPNIIEENNSNNNRNEDEIFNYENSNINPNIIEKNNSNNNKNEDEISIINEKKIFDKCNLCQREAKIICDCGCNFCNRHKINNKCPICKKIINKKTNIKFECGICKDEKKNLKHFNCECAFLVCEDCYKLLIENPNQNSRRCPHCRQLIS